MRKLAISAYVFLTTILVTSMAFASEGTATERIVDFVLSIAAPVLSMVALWLGHRVIKVFEDKTKLDIPASVEARIDEWVKQGVAYAEEKARQAAKAKAGKLVGPAKLEEAVGFVLDMAEQNGIDTLARDKVIKLVEAKLNLTR